MGLLPHQIHDFVRLTTSTFKRYQWTDISLEYPEYISSFLIDEKKVVETGGPYIEFRLKTKNTGNAKNTGLFAVDNTKVDDVSAEVKIPWTAQTTSWAYDIDEDIFQTDRETIVKSLQMRDHAANCDMAELNEENLWSAPADTSDDRPYGIPLWMQKDPTTAPDGGFNGGNPSGFPGGIGGLSSTTTPRWRNWTFGYAAVTADDLVRKIKRAIVFTDFRCPVPHPELGFGKSESVMYTTYRVIEPAERLAESRNDNLKADLARYMDSVTVGGIPFRMVHYLEANDTSDPIYGVQWRVFRPFVKRGANMRRSPPHQPGRQHNVREIHIDNRMNYLCYDRRRLFVGSKA